MLVENRTFSEYVQQRQTLPSEEDKLIAELKRSNQAAVRPREVASENIPGGSMMFLEAALRRILPDDQTASCLGATEIARPLAHLILSQAFAHSGTYRSGFVRFVRPGPAVKGSSWNDGIRTRSEALRGTLPGGSLGRGGPGAGRAIFEILFHRLTRWNLTERNTSLITGVSGCGRWRK